MDLSTNQPTALAGCQILANPLIPPPSGHGDLIELTMKAWKLDLNETLRRMTSLGVYIPAAELAPCRIERYK